MKYESALLAVKNIEISKKFYQDVLGQTITMDLGLNVSFEGFALQQNFAELIGAEESSVVNKSQNGELYFEVDNFDETEKTLQKYDSIQYVHPAKEYPWGQRVVRIYDPDFHIIEIGENMKVVIQRFLKQGYSVEETAQKTMFPKEVISSIQKELS